MQPFVPFTESPADIITEPFKSLDVSKISEIHDDQPSFEAKK
jgi:hypothetical protein